MTREWFTIAELAGLNLPDLPPSERQLARAAKAWDAHARKRSGRGGGMEYHINALPAAARLKLQIMAVDQAKTDRAPIQSVRRSGRATMPFRKHIKSCAKAG